MLKLLITVLYLATRDWLAVDNKTYKQQHFSLDYLFNTNIGSKVIESSESGYNSKYMLCCPDMGYPSSAGQGVPHPILDEGYPLSVLAGEYPSSPRLGCPT